MPSKHSSTSRSSSSSSSSRSYSSSSSSGSYSSGSSYSRPSSHSSTSHSSRKTSYNYNNSNRRYDNNNYYSNGYRRTYRQRYNQPIGYYSTWFWPTRRARPITYYCVNHNYIYYPESWTSRGKTYQAGYYDETGKYYEKRPFVEKEADKIYTKCPNCGYVSSYNYMDFNDLENCPTCGTKMMIAEDEDIFISQEEVKQKNSLWKIFAFITIVIICPLLVFGFLFSRYSYNKPTNNTPTGQIYNFKYGQPIYLTSSGNNTYTISSSSSGKKLEYVASEDSYYDAENDYWLWYNQEHKIWQYWYEPISSNFGEYGWMEHDQEGWWIEADYGNWIKVPSNFDLSKLYYIK